MQKRICTTHCFEHTHYSIQTFRVDSMCSPEEDKEVWLFNGSKAYYLHLYRDGRTWVVECKYGKRDTTLRTTVLASNAPFDVAYKIYTKRLKEKKNGGYEEGDE